MKLLRQIHGCAHDKAVFGRRVEVLARTLADFIPENARVLDIGCGSGTLARAIMKLRPDVAIEGIDVLVRPSTEDRKSTRLNSSHANISYAVFCLKKKKKDLENQR